MAQPKVFVSHSHVDDAFAERLVKDLRAAGADVWLDSTDLSAGDFQEWINASLKACDWFILVLTKDSLTSQWVRQEVHAANALKQSGELYDLILFQAGPIEHRELPALWRVYNILDGMSAYETAFNRIMKAISLIMPTSAPSPLLQSAASQQEAGMRGLGAVGAQILFPDAILEIRGAFARVRCPTCGEDGTYAHPRSKDNPVASVMRHELGKDQYLEFQKWTCKHCQAEFLWPIYAQ